MFSNYKCSATGKKALRAKGTLISEPRFSIPCEMRFPHVSKGKTAFVEGFSLKRPFFPFLASENCGSQGIANRGSLIGVPLALRGVVGVGGGLNVAFI